MINTKYKLKVAELMRAVKRGCRPEPCTDKACPPVWNDLVAACWSQDAARRPDIRTVWQALHFIGATAAAGSDLLDLGRAELPAVPC